MNTVICKPALVLFSTEPRSLTRFVQVFVAQRLRPDAQQPEIAADADKADAHLEVAARIGLRRCEDAGWVASALRRRMDFGNGLLYIDVTGVADPVMGGVQITRADEQAIDAVDRGDRSACLSGLAERVKKLL